MIRKIISILCIISILICSHANNTNASSATEVIELNRHKVIELALKNFVDVKLAQLKVDATKAQLAYVQSQIDLAGKGINSPAIISLPDTFEEIIASIPNYDELSEEEQRELDYIIGIQMMINQSLNPVLELVGGIQYSTVFTDYMNSVASLKQAGITAEKEESIAGIQLESTLELVKYQATYQYYELLKMQNELEQQQSISRELEIHLKDSNVLYSLGLIEKGELDRLQREYNLQLNLVIDQQKMFDLELRKFSTKLGIDRKKQVKLQPVSSYTSFIPTDEKKIDMSKMIELRLVEEEVIFNKEMAESANGNNPELLKYYQKITETQTETKAIIKLQISQYIEALVLEGNALINQVNGNEVQYEASQQSVKDIQLLFFAGKVTSKEVETVEFQRDRAHIALENSKLEYEIFKEKWLLVTNGVMVNS
ncbi:MAG: hypothetical protein NAG76_04700 [Candidatus Pristimantibacillus lignocellulolyticus]|uniref:Outer membrane efflux protein n=1 Tax=Candidatus Pristimantibacillus lignocellulolyticus TaxID=2994561 RepID=A0A9J6ZH79_9BACL|nr:MAG: hypothetical protein NAG76_04700 [Candidatus Pristimantibacillus lignocellulolyticus]